ncbi:hypothetical protein L596_010282 [Steinernema carpocapsae]|uniref:Nop domain-containing protein n=1 Tax=Steinernema carpocapsae TaxID=34508 RepID=A0A4U5PIC3_STECR|nr:hypothetical protein L596_010282 [Steinernema carpocapsae]
MKKHMERSMRLLALNLTSAVIGDQTAVTLMCKAGELRPMSQLPTDTLLAMGAQKRECQNVLIVNHPAQTGLQFSHNAVQSVRSDVRLKVALFLSSKSTLAIRANSVNQSRNGRLGRKLREQIQAKNLLIKLTREKLRCIVIGRMNSVVVDPTERLQVAVPISDGK